MPKYLLLAEKISKNIKQDSSSNYLKSLNNLIIEGFVAQRFKS
ncbi:hypothetical protein ABTC04_13045 [Acinetobacter baumannii]